MSQINDNINRIIKNMRESIRSIKRDIRLKGDESGDRQVQIDKINDRIEMYKKRKKYY